MGFLIDQQNHANAVTVAETDGDPACTPRKINLETCRFQTRVIRAGAGPDPATGAIVTPIHQSTNFVFNGPGEPREFEYSRCGNPTRKALENNLAALEGGTYCAAMATGQAAELVVMNLFKRGDHFICGNDVYGGTIRLFNHLQRLYGIEVSYLSLVDPNRVEDAIRPNTRGIWIETPSNPLFNIVDLEALADISRRHNLISIADNTLLSPYCQQPFLYGVDFVVHSAAKYLSGHNDGLGGILVCRDDQYKEEIAFIANALGAVLGAFDSWLIARGIKTLPLRMREHQKNALRVAEFLQQHPRVTRVYYPGLENHPQRELIQKQTSGYGGLLSFEIDGDFETARQILKNTRIFYIAESFGGTESLICHPKTMSHSSMSPEALAEAGITDRLIRLSVGLEDADDLIEDLEQALEN
jgi:cystathionine gamma-synthase